MFLAKMQLCNYPPASSISALNGQIWVWHQSSHFALGKKANHFEQLLQVRTLDTQFHSKSKIWWSSIFKIMCVNVFTDINWPHDVCCQYSYTHHPLYKVNLCKLIKYNSSAIHFTVKKRKHFQFLLSLTKKRWKFCFMCIIAVVVGGGVE